MTKISDYGIKLDGNGSLSFDSEDARKAVYAIVTGNDAAKKEELKKALGEAYQEFIDKFDDHKGRYALAHTALENATFMRMNSAGGPPAERKAINTFALDALETVDPAKPKVAPKVEPKPAQLKIEVVDPNKDAPAKTPEKTAAPKTPVKPAAGRVDAQGNPYDESIKGAPAFMLALKAGGLESLVPRPDQDYSDKDVRRTGMSRVDGWRGSRTEGAAGAVLGKPADKVGSNEEIVAGLQEKFKTSPAVRDAFFKGLDTLSPQDRAEALVGLGLTREDASLSTDEIKAKLLTKYGIEPEKPKVEPKPAPEPVVVKEDPVKVEVKEDLTKRGGLCNIWKKANIDWYTKAEQGADNAWELHTDGVEYKSVEQRHIDWATKLGYNHGGHPELDANADKAALARGVLEIGDDGQIYVVRYDEKTGLMRNDITDYLAKHPEMLPKLAGMGFMPGSKGEAHIRAAYEGVTAYSAYIGAKETGILLDIHTERMGFNNDLRYSVIVKEVNGQMVMQVVDPNSPEARAAAANTPPSIRERGDITDFRSARRVRDIIDDKGQTSRAFDAAAEGKTPKVVEPKPDPKPAEVVTTKPLEPAVASGKP
jgi:hypothetical protein